MQPHPSSLTPHPSITMNVNFACPRCEQSARVEVAIDAADFACPHCAAQIEVLEGAVEDGKLRRCLVCPCEDLFVRKDFPQRLGVGLVVVGLAGSTIAWGYRMPEIAYAILFGTALLDLGLYMMVGNALVCYRCNAHYRFLEGIDRYAPFDLETHERYRQQAARLAEGQKSRSEA